MNKVEIYQATLVSCDKIGEEKKGELSNKLLFTKTLEFTIVKTIDCVIDFERNVAIDLATNKEYFIVQRDNNGNILYGELEKIKQNILTVNSYYKKFMGDVSLLYRMFLNERAKNVFNKHLENLNNTHEQHEPQYVKKIGKRK